jgi:hypothetical protein
MCAKSDRSFSKDEWFEICKRIVPDLTWEEYEPLWENFLHDKAQQLPDITQETVISLHPIRPL